MKNITGSKTNCAYLGCSYISIPIKYIMMYDNGQELDSLYYLCQRHKDYYSENGDYTFKKYDDHICGLILCKKCLKNVREHVSL